MLTYIAVDFRVTKGSIPDWFQQGWASSIDSHDELDLFRLFVSRNLIRSQEVAHASPSAKYALNARRARSHIPAAATRIYKYIYRYIGPFKIQFRDFAVLRSVPRYSTVLSGELNFHPLRSALLERSGRISRAQTFARERRQPIANYYLVVDRSRTRSLHSSLAQYWDVTKSSLPFRRASHSSRWSRGVKNI